VLLILKHIIDNMIHGMHMCSRSGLHLCLILESKIVSQFRHFYLLIFRKCLPMLLVLLNERFYFFIF